MKKKTLLPIFIFFYFFSAAQEKIDTTKQVKISSQSSYKKGCGIKPYIFPAAAITYGFISLGHNSLHTLDVSTKAELQEDNYGFHTKIDNYLQYSPAIAVYALNAIGVKGENNFRDRTFIYAISTVISSAFVISVKTISKQVRPDGSGNNSFPSGHTTTAFAAAAFLQHEYKNVSPWYGIAGYAAATATGVLRLYNNRHWVGDIVSGAGFGVLSTKLAYMIYPVIKRKLFKNSSANTAILPYYQQHSYGLSMVRSFN